MALELYMIGLVVKDMKKSVEFYRRLGMDIPEGAEAKSHVQIKMESGLTLFLDSNPKTWDPQFMRGDDPGQLSTPGMKTILEFYLKARDAVDAKYSEMMGFGYQSYRAPYETAFKMYFAMVYDPDGNTILLSGDL